MNIRKMKCFATLLAVAALVGCTNDADVASRNLSVAADNFEIPRRIVFYNGITGEYMLTIEGLCSLGNSDQPGRLSVTCKTGPNTYKKNFLGLSNNVTFFCRADRGGEGQPVPVPRRVQAVVRRSRR